MEVNLSPTQTVFIYYINLNSRNKISAFSLEFGVQILAALRIRAVDITGQESVLLFKGHLCELTCG